jgi:hypothetical protein
MKNMNFEKIYSFLIGNKIVSFVIYSLKQVIGVFKDDQSKFRLITAFKMAGIPFLSLIILCTFLWLLLRLNLVFFEANGYSGFVELKEAYYERTFYALGELASYFGFFLILNVFMGIYVSDLLLRPFRIISEYCEKEVESGDAVYDPDFFSDLKLLTGISEYFINVMDNAKINGKLYPTKVPYKFTRIHRPVFEKGFFIQFSFFIFITSICAAIGIYVIIVDTYTNIVQLSITSLKSAPALNYFFKEQTVIFESILVGVMVAHVLLSILLSVNLYSKVAGPAFGFFATMRSFLKGAYRSRVHLVGYYYLRPYSRSINKYLEHLDKNILKEVDVTCDESKRKKKDHK